MAGCTPANIGHLDEDYLYITDRKKDLIISGGANIYPREVEEVISNHDAVAEVAVIGVPDSIKKPKFVDFVADLPKNATGKILKREIRNLNRLIGAGGYPPHALEAFHNLSICERKADRCSILLGLRIRVWR